MNVLPESHCSFLEKCILEECCGHDESGGPIMLHSEVAEDKIMRVSQKTFQKTEDVRNNKFASVKHFSKIESFLEKCP